MDIDIDFRSDFSPQTVFPQAIQASRIQDNDIKKHPAGIYFQKIPVDKVTNLAAIPYDKASDYGFFKIDFLHLSLLDHFESKEEIRILSQTEPDWTLLQIPSVVSKLFQLHRHFDLVNQIKPCNVQELADCIALIRPAKRFLIPAYLKNKQATRVHLYTKPTDGRPYFKKAHAIAYSLTIVLQLHLIKANII